MGSVRTGVLAIAASRNVYAKKWIGNIGGSTMTTAKWTKETILDKLDNSEEMVRRSLLRLYAEQTADEQAVGATTEHNGFGFNGVDAEFMSSVAKFLTDKGYLSPKQVAWTRKKIRKYAGQLATLANSELKLEEIN